MSLVSSNPESVDLFCHLWSDEKTLQTLVTKYIDATKGISPDSERFAALADFILNGYALKAELLSNVIKPYLRAHPNHVVLFMNQIIRRTSDKKSHPICFAIWPSLLTMTGFSRKFLTENSY
jgi:hypothetical protein